MQLLAGSILLFLSHLLDGTWFSLSFFSASCIAFGGGGFLSADSGLLSDILALPLGIHGIE